MAKVLRCADIGLACDFTVRARTEDELLSKAADHVKAVHPQIQLTNEVVAQVKGAIKSEGFLSGIFGKK